MISFSSKKLLDRIQLIESFITKGDKSNPAIEPLNEEYHNLSISAAFPEYINPNSVDSNIHETNNTLTESSYLDNNLVLGYKVKGKNYFYMNENKTVSEFKNSGINYDKIISIEI